MSVFRNLLIARASHQPDPEPVETDYIELRIVDTTPGPYHFKIATLDYLDGILEYSTDLSTWNRVTNTNLIPFPSSGSVYLRGMGNTKARGSFSEPFIEVFNRRKFEIHGLITKLLDYQNPVTTLSASCFAYIFQESGATTPIRLPDTITEIGESCFSGAHKKNYYLTKPMNIPKLLTTLPPFSFNNVHGSNYNLVEAFELPEGLTSIQSNALSSAFSRCNRLEYPLIFPSGLRVIDLQGVSYAHLENTYLYMYSSPREGYTTRWQIPVGCHLGKDATKFMFEDTGTDWPNTPQTYTIAYTKDRPTS